MSASALTTRFHYSIPTRPKWIFFLFTIHVEHGFLTAYFSHRSLTSASWSQDTSLNLASGSEGLCGFLVRRCRCFFLT